jgi:hypothetical protein
MKRLVLVMLISLMGSGSVWAEGDPSLLIYMSPDKYNRPVLVGVAPLYTSWVYQGQIAENAAFKALSTKFKDVGICDAGKAADIIAWVKPRLIYNPAVTTYYAKLKVEFHLGDGRPLATYKAIGHENGSIASIYRDDEVARAFDDAMQQIMQKMEADPELQKNIQNAMASDFTRNPCGMAQVLSGPRNKD